VPLPTRQIIGFLAGEIASGEAEPAAGPFLPQPAKRRAAQATANTRLSMRSMNTRIAQRQVREADGRKGATSPSLGIFCHKKAQNDTKTT